MFSSFAKLVLFLFIIADSEFGDISTCLAQEAVYFNITGYTNSSDGNVFAYEEERLQCVAWCVPSCDITTVQWINVNTYEIINSNIVVLTHLGVQTYTCTAYYMYNNQSFSASQTVRLSVFPAENNPRNSTESSFAPIVSSDLYISGVVLTGPNTGYAYMYDVITCTGFSNPRPTS